MIDKIQDIAIVIRSNFKLEDQGIEFITDNESTQQVGIMRRPKDYKVKDHIHLKQPGRKAVYTQEALLVRSGQIRVDLFKEDEFGIKFAKSVTLEKGDIICLLSGGHGITFLEESEILEIKQGPYTPDKDKEFI
uniref:Mannose-6-phosphate isomerase n=1 Tax=viral metagenome TaxID=1070528 RepID=A0A6M3KTQ1_9ZZZZ